MTETLDTDEFRRLMSLFATGVCIVSTAKPGGAPGGITVNSFVSVSLDPMLVCWSLQNNSSQFDLYANAENFAISILAEDQIDLARRYAARADTQHLDGDFEIAESGLPTVIDALAVIECKLWSVYPAGDHTMILGEVVRLGGGRHHDRPVTPLGFFNGKFCRIGD